MNLSLTLLIIGVWGFLLNGKNVNLIDITIEIMLLYMTFLILVYSLRFGYIIGQIYVKYII